MHPIQTIKNIIEKVKSDFKADPVVATGKLLGDVFQMVIGGEVIKTVSNTLKATALGDLTKKEVKAIQKVVNQAERPIKVVGAAANGTRWGIGSKLPIGKGAGTRSDIDYIAPPSSLPYFNHAKLPSIDSRTGTVPGHGNPFQGPVIRFEPGGQPVFIPANNY
jgi:hypothetical protein